MPYEITANRKRPQNFQELKGQEFVSATLEASLASGRIAHAYLFSGPRGCGKTSAARILAKSLNCETGPTASPCGVCRSCIEIARGASLDVIEIDGASNTSVDNVRQIKDEVLFPPNGGRYKVYIIDEVHMLSNSAFNALLKTIEEPPPYIVFIFATTELHKVPATIKSRCQQFAFRLFRVELIVSLLATAAAELGVEAEDEALLWIAKESGGSLRDAYTLFDQVVSFSEGSLSASLIRDKLGLTGLDALGELFRHCVAGASREALDSLDSILARGVSVEQLVVDCVDFFRSLLLLKHGISKASLLGAPAGAFDPTVLSALGSEQIERGLAALLDLYRNLRSSVEPRFELELVVARLCRLANYVTQAELAETIAALKRRVAGDGGAAPAASATLQGGEARGEKKKHELPPSLTAAFGSLAAAASQEEAADPQPSRHAGSHSAVRPQAKPAVLREDGPGDEPGAQEQEPAAGRTPGGEAPQDDPLRASVIDALGRSSPLLKTGLSASLPWRLEEGRLVIPFRSGIDESVVKGSIAAIAAKAAEVLGRTIKVELLVERQGPAGAQPRAESAGEEGDEGAQDGGDSATVVERVFRGTRVETRKQGERDESR